jgi:hypothetical protein
VLDFVKGHVFEPADFVIRSDGVLPAESRNGADGRGEGFCIGNVRRRPAGVDVKRPAAYRAEYFALSGFGSFTSAQQTAANLNTGQKACSCQNGKMAATSGILGFVDRGLASGLPRHPQKGAARRIPQAHPIRIFEGRPQRICTLFFLLFCESPLTIRPNRAFEYFVHPFQ